MSPEWLDEGGWGLEFEHVFIGWGVFLMRDTGAAAVRGRKFPARFPGMHAIACYRCHRCHRCHPLAWVVLVPIWAFLGLHQPCLQRN